MTEPLDACPVGKKGRHQLAAILPDTVEHPAVLFCEWCGTTRSVSLQTPLAADDVMAEVERIIERG